MSSANVMLEARSTSNNNGGNGTISRAITPKAPKARIASELALNRSSGVGRAGALRGAGIRVAIGPTV